MHGRKHGGKHGLANLFGFAGLVLTVVASGALFPGSSGVSVPDATIAAAQPSMTEILPAAPGLGTVGPSIPRDTAPAAGGKTDLPSGARGGTPDGAPGNPARNPAVAPPAGPAGGATPTPDTPSHPAIPPAPVTHVRVPSIGVDAAVLPLDSQPTGKTNAWGGPIYRTLEFPVDKDVRQWIRRGDPNTLPAAESAGDVKAFDRVMLFGHASDIGHHLVFQDLSAMRPGDPVIVTTALGTFEYRATLIATRTKTDLNSLAALYDYPPAGEKQIALVACLPDTTSNVVVLGTLDHAVPAAGPAAVHTSPAAP